MLKKQKKGETASGSTLSDRGHARNCKSKPKVNIGKA